MHYEPGSKFQIRRHEPPPPSGDYECFFGGKEWTRRQEASLRELSDEYPPVKGGRLGSSIDLTITAAIRTGQGHHSQVVRADIPSFPKPGQNVVAKFYDPLRAENDEDPEINVFWLADHQYAVEAAAYAKLSQLQGTLVPRLFGSYTCEVPTGVEGKTRSTRLLLLEFIRGTVMTSYPESTVRDLPQAARKTIMYKIVDAESRAYALGVRHADMHPRNIILEVDYPHPKPSNPGPNADADADADAEQDHANLGPPTLHPRLFDFGEAKLAPFETSATPALFRGQWDKPVSPILRWHAERGLHEPFRQAGWVDWEWQTWLEERWGGSNFYEPITTQAEEAWLLPSWRRVLG